MLFEHIQLKVKRFLVHAILCAALSPGAAFAAIGDGPRAYQVAPVGAQAITIIAAYEDSTFNLDGSPSDPAVRTDTDAYAIQYSTIREIQGNTAGFFALLPYASVEGNLINTSKNISESDAGDLQLGAVIGLVGAPALDAKQFRSFEPGLMIGILTKLMLPTGSYDSERRINIGNNRWSTQLGAVITWNFGDLMLPGHQSTLEVLPSVWIYGENTDPNNGGNKMEQAPLYSIEMHLTHDFNQTLWGSIDALYMKGGETTTDGGKAENAADIGGMGITLGLNLPKGVSLQLGYGTTVKDDVDGLKDRLLRFKFGKSFQEILFIIRRSNEESSL